MFLTRHLIALSRKAGNRRASLAWAVPHAGNEKSRYETAGCQEPRATRSPIVVLCQSLYDLPSTATWKIAQPSWIFDTVANKYHGSATNCVRPVRNARPRLVDVYTRSEFCQDGKARSSHSPCRLLVPRSGSLGAQESKARETPSMLWRASRQPTLQSHPYSQSLANHLKFKTSSS